MASKDDKKQDDAAQPGFDPKPVQVGGESIVDRLMPYRKQILIFVLLGFAVWGTIAIVFYVRDNKRTHNTARIVSVLDVAGREVKAADEPPDPNADPNAPKAETFKTNKERAQAVLDAATKAGADLSSAYKGSMLLQAGHLDEAIAEYRKGQTGRTLDAILCREGLGLALESKATAEKDAAARQKGLEDALAVFQTMQPDDKGPRAAYAHYHQGRLLAVLGKTTEARAALQKAKDLGGEGSPLADAIDERLASLGAS